MVATYTIAGRQVGSHVVRPTFSIDSDPSNLLTLLKLSMLTLGTMATIPFLMSGGKGAKKDNTPPINAGSKDEEKFIQYESKPPVHQLY